MIIVFLLHFFPSRQKKIVSFSHSQKIWEITNDTVTKIYDSAGVQLGGWGVGNGLGREVGQISLEFTFFFFEWA